MMRDEFEQRGFELFLAAVDHVHLLQVGGKAVAVQLRSARQRAANVPGVSRATHRPVDDVQRVGNRIQHHARAAKHAGALADGAGDAVLAAGHFGGLAASAARVDDLFFAAWQKFNHAATFTFAATRFFTSRLFMRSNAHSSMTFAPRLR